MLERSTSIAIVFCTTIITLLIMYTFTGIVSFFSKDRIIEKETIAGITPNISTKSSMFYEEQLTIMIREQEKEKLNIENEKEVLSAPQYTELKIEDNIEKQSENNKTEQLVEVAWENIAKMEETKPVEQEVTVPTEYKGFASIGKIEIPKTGVDIPILNQVTVKGMENAPCLLYSTGELNHNGNNLIVGHNYRNGNLFSDNKNLNLGDKIYITTLNGQKVEYTIYNKFVTTAEDVSYIKRDTDNKPEITLSCCTDDDEYRIIILAKI